MDSLVSGTLLARRYRLLDRIGVGGMSVIWRAHDELLDRRVAIKVLANSLATDPRFRELVRTEARAAAALVHPKVTAVYDYGEALDAHGNVTAYVVMELLDGRPLSARLTAGPLPWQEAVQICADVADALAAAHRHGIVHRDITPDNVMLTEDGVKVLDFGIATRIGAPDEDADGETFGTPAYVAPERLHGRRARPATDTYALGVMLYEALTGRPPFPAETWEELAELVRDDPPRPTGVPDLPEEVAVLCQHCLAPEPLDRPTAYQVAHLLRRYLPQTGNRKVRRVLALAGTAGALTVGVLVGATLLAPAPAALPDLAGGGSAPVTTPAHPAPPPPPGAPTPAGHQPTGPDADGATPPPTPAAAPTADPPETPAPVELSHLYRLIDDGAADGEIRDDVALDLRQLVDHLQLGLALGTADLSTATVELRNKVFTRANEGTLSWESAVAFDLVLTQLAG